MTEDRDIRIFLIRHGESEANLDKSINRRIADHRVSLSSHGHEQAASAGNFLYEYLTQHPGSGRLRLWQSPYLRTKQTARAIIDAMPHLITDTRESIFLREIEFGIFDGVPDLELLKLFPHEYAHYQKCKAFEGEIYARMPGGESRIDVCQRVHQFFGTIQRDAVRHGIDNIIVVSHGVTVRCFAMMWCNHTVEWLEAERNPANCSIRLLKGGEDCGLIYTGITDTPAGQQEEREDGRID